MRSDLEMTAEILRQVRERRAAQKKRRAVLGLSAGTLAVAVVAVGVVWGTALHRKPDAEPTVGDFKNILREARDFGADSVVGIGGGSVLDLAKLVAALVDSDQQVEDLFGTGLVGKKGKWLA